MHEQGVGERLGGRRLVKHVEVVEYDDGIARKLVETPEQGLRYPGARPTGQRLESAPANPGHDPSQGQDKPRAEQARICVPLVEREPSHGALDPMPRSAS
jgi:hypothetical protein